MGHVPAIAWVYQHPGLHEEDSVREYSKVEPYLSLNPSEVVTERRVRAEFEEGLQRLERQIQEYVTKGAVQRGKEGIKFIPDERGRSERWIDGRSL